MNSYQFETSQFGISDQGIHLLRNRFNYQTIPFSQIVGAEIRKGKALKHWPITLILGCLLLVFAVAYGGALVDVFESATSIYWEELLVPVMPFLLGLFCIYFALRKEMILEVSATGMGTKRLSLTDVIKEGKQDELQRFLNARINLQIK